MACSFNGSNQYLIASSAAATSLPVTLACWFYPNNTTSNGALVTLSDNATAGVCMINAAGAVANDPLRATYSTNTGVAVADTAQSFSASVWSHAAGVFTSTQVSAWLNGQKTSVSDTKAFPSVTRTTIGARINTNAAVGLTNGAVAEAAIWSVALLDDEVLSLSNGASPRLIRPQSLVFYAPLIRDFIDVRGGLAITNNGAATVAVHPRVYA